MRAYGIKKGGGFFGGAATDKFLVKRYGDFAVAAYAPHFLPLSGHDGLLDGMDVVAAQSSESGQGVRRGETSVGIKSYRKVVGPEFAAD